MTSSIPDAALEYLSRLRSNGLVTTSGAEIRASDALFGG